jgi:sortase A
VFREVPLLMKVGVIMMSLALALVLAAVVLSAALRGEPERVVASEAAANSPDRASRSFPGQLGSATENSSSQKQPSHYPSREEESLRFGSSSSFSGRRAEHSEQQPSEQQGSLQHKEAQSPNSHSPTPQPAANQTHSGASSEPEPQPHHNQTDQQQQPLLSGSEQREWPKPTQRELQRANGERRYELLPGAIMGLTIEEIGIYEAPVFDSDSRLALAKGVAHNPQTSLPWSQSAQRNVYLAGHRMGYRGTWSRMIFYKLPKLDKGDEVVLKDRAGTSYRYRVSEVFVAEPKDVWVMGQVRGRDMVTLQTCVPYPTFEKRLIVRADRV